MLCFVCKLEMETSKGDTASVSQITILKPDKVNIFTFLASNMICYRALAMY